MKILGIVLTVIGVIVLFFAVLADTVGIGEGTAFGYKQWIGVILGTLGIAIGRGLVRKA